MGKLVAEHEARATLLESSICDKCSVDPQAEANQNKAREYIFVVVSILFFLAPDSHLGSSHHGRRVKN